MAAAIGALMAKDGQTPELQARRLAEGRCPVHGLGFTRVGDWYRLPSRDEVFTIVRCTRRICPIHARQTDPGGPAVALDPRVPIVAHRCGRDVDGRWQCAPDRIEIWPAQCLTDVPGNETEMKPRVLRYLRRRERGSRTGGL